MPNRRLAICLRLCCLAIGLSVAALAVTGCDREDRARRQQNGPDFLRPGGDVLVGEQK